VSRVALFRGPVCGAPLAKAERLYRCPRGHAFDVARQGYVNLLRKGARGRGDPLRMLQARRAFLEAGYYKTLSERLNRLVEEAAESLNREVRVLDAGRGEGFYLRRLQQVSAEPQSLIRCGIDISRDAIRLAARRDPGSPFWRVDVAAFTVAGSRSGREREPFFLGQLLRRSHDWLRHHRRSHWPLTACDPSYCRGVSL
jgi:SAM-dependent methyltransferase